jgi:arylsulfatase K
MLCVIGVCSAPAAERPKNILLIECDSMDGRALGCMGHPAMRRATPNLDALARQGTLFRNTYTNSPICCPSRASMFSGLQTHHCEGWNNYKGLEPGTPTFQDRLAAAGYLTQTFGKADYLSGQHSMRARVSAWTRSANIERPNYREPAPRILDRDETRVHAQDWNTAEAVSVWLKERHRGEKPFFLYLGLEAPHPPFVSSRTYTAMIDEAGIGIPPADEYDHPVMRYQRIVKNWEHGFSAAMVKNTRLTYFAMIAETDAIACWPPWSNQGCGTRPT